MRDAMNGGSRTPGTVHPGTGPIIGGDGGGGGGAEGGIPKHEPSPMILSSLWN